MSKRTVRDLDVKGKKVIVRVDFNVPHKGDTITDDNRIVAGMTSSKTLEHSKLDSTINKGNVRIWAGEMQNSGDLTSAPFTVTSTGELKSTKANITG